MNNPIRILNQFTTCGLRAPGLVEGPGEVHSTTTTTTTAHGSNNNNSIDNIKNYECCGLVIPWVQGLP